MIGLWLIQHKAERERERERERGGKGRQGGGGGIREGARGGKQMGDSENYFTVVYQNETTGKCPTRVQRYLTFTVSHN